MGGMINAYIILVGESERRRSLRRPSRRWEDTRMNLRETGWEVLDWIHLT
jgi:hypothetical protein